MGDRSFDLLTKCCIALFVFPIGFLFAGGLVGVPVVFAFRALGVGSTALVLGVEAIGGLVGGGWLCSLVWPPSRGGPPATPAERAAARARQDRRVDLVAKVVIVGVVGPVGFLVFSILFELPTWTVLGPVLRTDEPLATGVIVAGKLVGAAGAAWLCRQAWPKSRSEPKEAQT